MPRASVSAILIAVCQGSSPQELPEETRWFWCTFWSSVTRENQYYEVSSWQWKTNIWKLSGLKLKFALRTSCLASKGKAILWRDYCGLETNNLTSVCWVGTRILGIILRPSLLWAKGRSIVKSFKRLACHGRQLFGRNWGHRRAERRESRFD